MSDLEIRSGGIVAVDVASLRAAAAEISVVAVSCRTIAERLGPTVPVLSDAGYWHLTPVESSLLAAAAGERIATGLRDMADLYELVERAATERLTDPVEWLTLARAQAQRASDIDEGFRPHQAFGGLLLGGLGLALVSGALGLVQIVDRGRLTAGTTLTDGDGGVRTTLLSAHVGTAPATLAELTARIPAKTEARVRVERYDMPDGTVQFVAYADGTQAGASDDEPFDLESNLDLYLRHEESESYRAVRQALEAAGAGEGATVHLVGYSQGAMVASHIALSGDYRVPTIITVGSPVEADVGEDTLSVSLRHTDDPVSYLATGGFATGVGAVGSLVAERRIGAVGLIGPHRLEHYRETAAMLDRSTDPRMDAVRARLGELGAATKVTVSTYSTVRAEPGGGRGGGGV